MVMVYLYKMMGQSMKDNGLMEIGMVKGGN